MRYSNTYLGVRSSSVGRVFDIENLNLSSFNRLTNIKPFYFKNSNFNFINFISNYIRIYNFTI